MARVLRAVKPNAGVRAKYRRRLDALLDATHRSVLWWIRAAYRKDEDRIVLANEFGEDASPAANLERALRRLTRQWTDKWDEAADEIAEEFVETGEREVTSSMLSAMRDAGWTVSMPRTRVYNATVRAYVDWNVGLIKSIGRDYLDQVSSLVMRSAAMGRDVKFLEDELAKRYEITQRRAHFIARDQSNKATEAIKRARYGQMGITHAIWVHLPGLKTSRETHMEMDGKAFRLEDGMYDSDVGRWIMPSELPGCSCTSRPIIPEFADSEDAADE